MLLGSHTDYIGTGHLHVQIEYVLLDYSVLYIGVHTDYTHTSLLYVQIENVFSVSGDLQIFCHTGRMGKAFLCNVFLKMKQKNLVK